jgi:hypothetical protein
MTQRITHPDTHPESSDHSVVAAPLGAHPLARLIADEIRERSGWMSFERYMERALYTPGLGSTAVAGACWARAHKMAATS